ncbi:MAG: thioredoxin family protein [Pirellulales bacterium]
MRIAHRVVVAGTAVVLSWGAALASAQQPSGSAFVPPPPAAAPPTAQPAIPQPPAAPLPAAAVAAELQWLENLDIALGRAAAERKFVLVHFWNDNCPPCVMVERNVFSRADVQQAISANFIPVKIKVDDQPEIAKKMRVERWPTDVLLTADGRELYRTVSSQNPNQYVALLSRVATTARGAAAGVQDAARTANQWADRVSNSIPQFGAAPAANASPPASESPAPNARSAFAPPPPAAFAPPPASPPPQPAPAAAAPAPQTPAVQTPAAAGLGLEGFCPVTLQATRKWRRGDARWGAVHRDRTYLFAGPDEQKVFLENPDKFAPMLSGYDAVRYAEQGQLVEGRRQHGVWYRNQMYLFADEATLERFWKNPDLVVPRVEQAMRATASGGVRR